MKELISQGHSMCAGCGIAMAMNQMAKVCPENAAVSCATGCLEVTTSVYPLTAWKVPWIHAAFECAPAVASGMEAAAKKLGKDMKIISLAGDGGCYTPGTKILASEGLKPVEKLENGEILWSINPKTMEIEKAKIKKMHIYDYNDKIVSVKHNFVHFDVSLYHNIPIFDKIDNRLSVIKAHELLKYGRSDRVNIITGNLKWKGGEEKYFKLPKVENPNKYCHKRSITNIPMNLWLEFLGYWISEGHLSIKSSKRERYNVFISQTGIKNVKKIKSCLKKLPFKFWYSKDRFIISNQQLWCYLKKFKGAANKAISEGIKDLQVRQLKILLDALILGDGEKVKYKKSITFKYSTISEKLKNDVIEIALKMGFRVHLDSRKRKGRFEYNICISDYKPTTLANLRKKHISTYNYNGKIYCPELEKNHILIIEKDGRISLNMNSFDIGLQALSGMLERGHKVTHICVDNECYANCLALSATVMTKDGLKRITEIKEGDELFAFDMNTRKPALKRCSGVFDNGVKEVYDLGTLHHVIRATANHPFLTLERCGRNKEPRLVWKTLSELKVGDCVFVLNDIKTGFRKEKVKYKKLVGEEPTLDLRVEGEHNFIADGIVVHNTGIQRSGATPFGAWTTTTPVGKKMSGKKEFSKPMAEIAAAHRIPYVATASVAYPEDLQMKVKKALEMQPSFLLIQTPCPPSWKMDSSMSVKAARLAVQSRMWVLYEIEKGRLRISMKPEKIPVNEYLNMQGRFKHLTPEQTAEIQKQADAEWDRLEKIEKAGISF